MTAITFRTSPGLLAEVAASALMELRRVARNRRYVLFTVAFPLFFYLLYTNVGVGVPAADLPTWRAFFMVSMATYGAMGASLFMANAVAEERRSGWTRQLRVTPLRPAAYLLSKLIVSIATSLPSLLLVAAAGATLNQVSLPATTWVQFVLLLTLGVLPFVALGLLIGLVFDATTTQVVVIVTYFGLAILGGLWAQLSSLPETVATIGHMLPSFRLADLGWQTVAGAPVDPIDVLVLVAYGLAFGGLVAWRYRSQELVARA